MSQDPLFSVDPYLQSILPTKASDVVVLDVHRLTSIADMFIICSGSSNRQVTAIAESIQRNLKKVKISALSVEGKTEGHWVLLDYGHVIIHVFLEPVRLFYDLEGLWVDAKRILAKSRTGTRAGSRPAEDSHD
ncbi:MAG: ribosome silencing factor [Desulfobacterales bacterium]|nr:ribosome silencing factor [Desulfobacterales bacterium]